MIWVRSVFLNSQKSKILLSLMAIFMTFPSLAQVSVNPSTTTGSMSFNLNSDQILSVRLQVTDADYTNEGQLFVNGQGPIELFDGVDSANNDKTIYFNVNIGNNQADWFNYNGARNDLEFRFFDDPQNAGVNDGFTIISVKPITELPKKVYDAVPVRTDGEISQARFKALDIYKRLVGVRVPIDHPILVEMEELVARGDLTGAAQIATNEPGFYNLVVRDFAARMSTRDQSINEEFNDFIATFIGVTRDDIDARQLLTGSFYYKGSIDAPVDADIMDDILGSNDHYQQLAGQNYDFATVLERENTQYIRTNNDDNYIEHPDAAGVITSRAFMGAHAIDGTNRRLVEYTVKQFACFDLEEWADATAPDTRVGPDIDRFPGGEGSKYLTTCKACHSVMDGFRGAFAKYDFDNNYVRYRTDGRDRNTNGNNLGQRIEISGIDNKMNQNHSTFSNGYITRDNSWINNARSPANVQKFGWRGVVSAGNGVKQFGRAIANSKAFSRCMTKKVYRELCRRPVASFETSMVESMAQSFESSGYKLKKLFEDIAVRPECLGVR